MHIFAARAFCIGTMFVALAFSQRHKRRLQLKLLPVHHRRPQSYSPRKYLTKYGRKRFKRQAPQQSLPRLVEAWKSCLTPWVSTLDHI